MWMEFKCGALFVAEPPLGRQHFFQVVCGCPRVYWMRKILASFFCNSLRHRGTVVAGSVDCEDLEVRSRRASELPPSGLRNGNNSVTISSLPPSALTLDADGVHRRKPAGSHYSFSRTALKVPCFEGPSPTSGEKSTSPVIKSGVSNFPLSVKVPASRPTLPIRNSTGPENVTEFPSPGVHFASEGLAPAQTLDCGSVTVRVPFPSLCASKRRKRCWSLAKVISTFQLPVTFGDSASARTKENVFTAITRIIARAAFTFFSTSNLICAQIHWVLRLQFTRSTVGTHELFSEFPSHPPSHATARQAIHQSLITNHRLRSWRGRWATSRRWESSWCWARPRGCSWSRLGGRSSSRRGSQSQSQ